MRDHFCDDVCRCDSCRRLAQALPAPLHQNSRWPELRAARPQAAPLSSSPAPADEQRPVRRGPVQDESGRLDPLDARAMRQVEGRVGVHLFIDDVGGGP